MFKNLFKKSVKNSCLISHPVKTEEETIQEIAGNNKTYQKIMAYIDKNMDKIYEEGFVKKEEGVSYKGAYYVEYYFGKLCIRQCYGMNKTIKINNFRINKLELPSIAVKFIFDKIYTIYCDVDEKCYQESLKKALDSLED